MIVSLPPFEIETLRHLASAKILEILSTPMEKELNEGFDAATPGIFFRTESRLIHVGTAIEYLSPHQEVFRMTVATEGTRHPAFEFSKYSDPITTCSILEQEHWFGRKNMTGGQMSVFVVRWPELGRAPDALLSMHGLKIESGVLFSDGTDSLLMKCSEMAGWLNISTNSHKIESELRSADEVQLIPRSLTFQ